MPPQPQHAQQVSCFLLKLYFVLRTSQRRQREPALSVPHFRRSLKAMRSEWRYSTTRFVSLTERGNDNINYFITSGENRTHNPLRHDWSHIVSINETKYFFVISASKVGYPRATANGVASSSHHAQYAAAT